MATKWDRVPKFNDDVAKSSMEDARKVVKDTSKLRGAAVDAVKEAGSRAASRLLGRAGLAGASLQTGYDAGRAIDEATGIGKKMVDKSGLGDMAAKTATSGDRVTLTKEAQDRIDSGELEEKASSKPMNRTMEDKSSGGGGGSRLEPRDRTLMENREPKEEAMKHGGRVHASRRADGIAQRGHTRYRGDKK